MAVAFDGKNGTDLNRNEDFFGHFCINSVPWWCKHTIFLGYTNYLYMNLDYKNP